MKTNKEMEELEQLLSKEETSQGFKFLGQKCYQPMVISMLHSALKDCLANINHMYGQTTGGRCEGRVKESRWPAYKRGMPCTVVDG